MVVQGFEPVNLLRWTIALTTEPPLIIITQTDYIHKMFLIWKRRWSVFSSMGCHHSSVDSSVPSILPSRVWLPSMPSMLFSFIVKFVLYLSMQCEKRTKINKKEAGFGPIKKRLQMMMAWIILKIFSERSRGPGLKKWFMITWGWGWSEIMCRNLILLPKSDIKNQWLDFHQSISGLIASNQKIRFYQWQATKTIKYNVTGCLNRRVYWWQITKTCEYNWQIAYTLEYNVTVYLTLFLWSMFLKWVFPGLFLFISVFDTKG